MSSLFTKDQMKAMSKSKWTDLSRLRAQVDRLQKKYDGGEASDEEMERLSSLKELLDRNTREAFEKWRKTFGR
jgi:hypothetical protein